MLNKEYDLYQYMGTDTDNLQTVMPPGSLNAIIAKFSKTFTIKSPGEPTFHLEYNYKTKTVSNETRATKNKRKVKQRKL
jgi:hypothetical protein